MGAGQALTKGTTGSPMTEATVRERYPIGTRVQMSDDGIRILGKAASWRGTVRGYCRDGTGLRVAPDGRHDLVALHLKFIERADEPSDARCPQ